MHQEMGRAFHSQEETSAFLYSIASSNPTGLAEAYRKMCKKGTKKVKCIAPTSEVGEGMLQEENLTSLSVTNV
jgi:hypothetical protein